MTLFFWPAPILEHRISALTQVDKRCSAGHALVCLLNVSKAADADVFHDLGCEEAGLGAVNMLVAETRLFRHPVFQGAYQ